jgi:MFS transporter, DHA1 family, inner membrane transport protein
VNSPLPPALNIIALARFAALFFFMGQTLGPIAYGFGIEKAGKIPTLLMAAAIMIALRFACARLLRQSRPADSGAGAAG